MCKHADMTKLHKFLTATKTTQTRIAAAVGVSRGYMSELVAGSKTPSLGVAVGIERFSCGAVPASSWVEHISSVGGK